MSWDIVIGAFIGFVLAVVVFGLSPRYTADELDACCRQANEEGFEEGLHIMETEHSRLLP